jgi:hypothetical protein
VTPAGVFGLWFWAAVGVALGTKYLRRRCVVAAEELRGGNGDLGRYHVNAFCVYRAREKPIAMFGTRGGYTDWSTNPYRVHPEKRIYMVLKHRNPIAHIV